MKTVLLIACSIFTINTFGQMAKSDGKGYVNDVLNVRFSEGFDLKITGNGLLVDGVSAIPQELAAIGYWSSLYTVPSDKLDSLWQNAQKNLNKKLPDPKSVLLFHLHDASGRDQAAAMLRELSFVKRVSAVPIPMNADAPDYESSQLYLHNGAPGINAQEVWTTYNSRGAGIKVCDIEYTFNPQHIDLPNVTLLGMTPEDPFGNTSGNHGTAVLGELASLDNGTGTKGIAPDCELFFSGAYHEEVYDFENAMLLGVLAVLPGDVILIEQQIAGPNYTGDNQHGLVPMEWYQSCYEAIQLAVGNGVIVVEAAGNGGEDLDNWIYSEENDGHYPFLPGNGSGAIIVGAGAVGVQDTERSKLWFSNYGSCVHLQGNGEHVTTTGYGDLFAAEGTDAEFTEDFGGTSSASPIVTGAVVLLQSYYLQETGSRLPVEELLDILLLTGKPQEDGALFPASDHIGPLPDIAAAISYVIHLGTEEREIGSLSAYPNPGNGAFTLRGEQEMDPKSFVVHDVTGKAVDFQAQAIAGNCLSIQLPGGASGIYFLQHTGTGSTLRLAVTR